MQWRTAMDVTRELGPSAGHVGARAAGVRLGTVGVQPGAPAVLAEPAGDQALPLPAQGALSRGLRGDAQRNGSEPHRQDTAQGSPLH